MSCCEFNTIETDLVWCMVLSSTNVYILFSQELSSGQLPQQDLLVCMRGLLLWRDLLHHRFILWHSPRGKFSLHMFHIRFDMF